MSTLPEMTVELRESDTAHGLRAPLEPGSPEYNQQLSDMIELCQGAKKGVTPDNAWPARVLELLKEYAPFGMMAEIPTALSEFGFSSWSECVRFVMDDNCDDFASIVLRWTQGLSLPHKTENGFIDGDGIGFKRRYIDRLGRKTGSRGTLEKTFDAKYYFQQKRPLVELIDRMGEPAAKCLMNYVHPGHYSYPAGHGAKFFEVVDLARDTWTIGDYRDNMLLVAAYVLAMARSGGGVHFPEDNIASGYLAGLPEFKEYAA